MPKLIAVRASSSRMFIDAWRRIEEAGDAVLPIDPRAPDGAVARLVRSANPSMLLTTPPGRPGQLRTIRFPESEPVRTGTSVVITTSGTTGQPKAVLISARAFRASTTASLDRLGAVDGERWLLCLPWHHIAGLSVVKRARALGKDPEVLDRFTEVGFASLLADREIDWVSLVPTQLHRLLEAKVDLQSLRGVLLGGAAADPALLERADAAGVRVITSYGMTETCGGCVYDGEPLDGITTTILPDGRIRIAGRTLADGYRLDHKATAKSFTDDGFVTQDLGRYDETGRLHVVGRADDMVVSGGENVPSGVLATCLRTHPDVTDAAVVGVPDELWGHVVAAAVVVRPGATVDLDILRDHVAAELPRTWAPRKLAVVDALPVSAMGKPSRAAVRLLFTTA